jgi:hypothetical protein
MSKKPTGRPRKDEPKKAVHTYLDESTFDRLQKAVETLGTTLAGFVRDLIVKAVK